MWIAIPFAVVLAGGITMLALAKPATQGISGSPLLAKTAPPLHGQALLNGPAGGGPVTLTSYRGCWALVNFAASWCIPCHQEMPQLKAFAASHAARHDATIITVAYDQSDLAHLRSFQQSWHVDWPVIDQAQAVVDWGVAQIPTSYLIDPEGTIAAAAEGPVNAASLNRIINHYPTAACPGTGA